MKIKLLYSGKIIEGKTPEDIVMRLGHLHKIEDIPEYLAKVRRRFNLTYNIILFCTDADNFIKAVDATGKYFKLLKGED